MDFKRDIDAVIFDMDGVIVDSEPLHEAAFHDIFNEMGLGNGRHGIEFTQYYGKSDRTLWLDFIEKHHPSQPIEELIAWKQNHFLSLLRARQPIFKAIPGLVAAIAQRYPLAVASGSNHVVIREVLGMRDLSRHFRAVASVEDVGRTKPFPDVFLRAAALLGVDPGRCVAIEDSAAGVQSAVDAGMRVIAITNTLPASKLSHAHCVVSRYDEIAQLLDCMPEDPSRAAA